MWLPVRFCHGIEGCTAEGKKPETRSIFTMPFVTPWAACMFLPRDRRVTARGGAMSARPVHEMIADAGARERRMQQEGRGREGGTLSL